MEDSVEDVVNSVEDVENAVKAKYKMQDLSRHSSQHNPSLYDFSFAVVGKKLPSHLLGNQIGLGLSYV